MRRWERIAFPHRFPNDRWATNTGVGGVYTLISPCLLAYLLTQPSFWRCWCNVICPVFTYMAICIGGVGQSLTGAIASCWAIKNPIGSDEYSRALLRHQSSVQRTSEYLLTETSYYNLGRRQLCAWLKTKRMLSLVSPYGQPFRKQPDSSQLPCGGQNKRDWSETILGSI